jgi:hypothetical protein
MDNADVLADLLEVEDSTTSHGMGCEEVPNIVSFAKAAEKYNDEDDSKGQRGFPLPSSHPKMRRRRSFSVDDADFFVPALLADSSRGTGLDLDNLVLDGIEETREMETIEATAENGCLEPPPAEMDSPTAFDAPSRRPKVFDTSMKSMRRNRGGGKYRDPSHNLSPPPFTTSLQDGSISPCTESSC